MNPQYEINPGLHDMTQADLDAILLIEKSVHTAPWTRGNFEDGLQSRNIAKVYTVKNEIIGYAVLMQAVDEVQLLNISIAMQYQRQGFGMRLLSELKNLIRHLGVRRILLEVRQSNQAARDLYQAAGFVKIGVRRGYYKGADVVVGQTLEAIQAGEIIPAREDAIIMECLL
ncbi:MAG: ribosomal protein S18-alanine N-acetyltransferase [Candidatus Nitrotoga sp.]